MLEPRRSTVLAPHSLQARAVLTGSLVDIGGTIHAQIVTSLLAGLLATAGGISVEASFAFYLINLVSGLFFTGFGGYTAARTARYLPLQHALFTGLISLAVSVALTIGTPGTFVLSWPVLLGLLSVVPIALLGGWLAQAEREV